MQQAQAVNSAKPSFWLLHLLGWFNYVVIFSFDNILFTHEKDVSFTIIFPLFLSACMAATLTLPLRYLYRRCWNLSANSLILTIAFASFVVALIWTPSKNINMWYFSEGKDVFMWLDGEQVRDHNPWAILTSLSYAFFMILVWSAMYFGINYHYRLVREKQLYLEALRLSHQAQIKMLRYQINPHFLFNTLNAISTLVLQGNKEKADGMLVRLSTFLRFSLDNDPEKKVPLIEEIKALMLYLEIEKTRFEDRLNIEMSINQDAESALVPSLLLQPIVENSIKYAIALMPSDGMIKVEAKIQFDQLRIQVSDNGPGMAMSNDDALESQKAVAQNEKNKEQGHKGVGIVNIKNRLAVLYPEQHVFTIESAPEQGFMVTIKIPVERSV